MYEKLRKALAERHLSVNKLAKMSDIHPQSLYMAVNGKVPFYEGWKTRVAEALEMAVEELFRGED